MKKIKVDPSKRNIAKKLEESTDFDDFKKKMKKDKPKKDKKKMKKDKPKK